MQFVIYIIQLESSS